MLDRARRIRRAAGEAGAAMIVYDRQGKPITSVSRVNKLLTDMAYKRVALTLITSADKSFRVSTVWLGLDHSHTMHGPPVIFETMVFDANGNTSDEFAMDRYSTEAEARQGHADMVTVVRATLPDPVIEDIT